LKRSDRWLDQEVVKELDIDWIDKPSLEHDLLDGSLAQFTKNLIVKAPLVRRLAQGDKSAVRPAAARGGRIAAQITPIIARWCWLLSTRSGYRGLVPRLD
jgi:hypothetical protein